MSSAGARPTITRRAVAFRPEAYNDNHFPIVIPKLFYPTLVYKSMDLTSLNEERDVLLQRIFRLEAEHQQAKDSSEKRLRISTELVYFRKQLSYVQTKIIELILNNKTRPLLAFILTYYSYSECIAAML